MREAEREHELQALVAVQINAHAPLQCADVLRDALRQLRNTSERAPTVTWLAPATFLFRFDSTELRNLAYSKGAFYSGEFGLRFLAWSRRTNATAASLKFRARICLEGVQPHARQAETVAQLFSAPSFIDEIDYNIEK